MTVSYRTISGTAHAELEIKRSRFFCTLRRVASEEQARAVIADCRREHFDARHHCSAYVLRVAPGAASGAGASAPLMRSNDDGEPAGTAGAPMLDALRGAGVQDVVAVATRWFGGILLGTGGLVRAYGGVVRAALQRARMVRCEQRLRVAVDLPHADAGRIESALHQADIPILDRAYGTHATLVALVDDEEALRDLLLRLTGGQAPLRRLGPSWTDVPLQ